MSRSSTSWKQTSKRLKKRGTRTDRETATPTKTIIKEPYNLLDELIDLKVDENMGRDMAVDNERQQHLMMNTRKRVSCHEKLDEKKAKEM